MIHHPNYCNSYSSGLFVLKYICEKLFKPGNIETTWRPQSYCSYWGWFENNDFAGCPRASKKDGNMARSTATLKTWESHVWVAKIGSRILRSWIVWFQESSEFASSSDPFSYEQCPVEPLLACGGSSPHLKDSGTDQLTKTMTFWTYGLFLYLYHIRGWYDVCNNMYIVRMNIHPTTIFCSPALRLPTLPWAQTAPAFAPRLVRAARISWCLSSNHVHKIRKNHLHVFWFQKGSRYSILKKNTCSRYDILITVLLSCMSCIMFFIQLLWLLYNIYIYTNHQLLVWWGLTCRCQLWSSTCWKGNKVIWLRQVAKSRERFPKAFAKICFRESSRKRFSASMNYFAHFHAFATFVRSTRQGNHTAIWRLRKQIINDFQVVTENRRKLRESFGTDWLP